MPEVYDPTDGSMFRSRRQRKRKIANRKKAVVSRATSNGSASQARRTSRVSRATTLSKKSSINDPLNFGGNSDVGNNDDNDALLTSTELDDRFDGTRRKQKVCRRSRNSGARKTASTETTHVKGMIDGQSQKPSAATPLSLPVTVDEVSETSVAIGRAKRDLTTSSTKNFFQYAIAFDTRYLNTQVGKDDQEDFQRGVKDFLQTTFCRRGFSAPVVTWTEYCNNDTTSLANNDGSNITILSEPLEGDKIDKILLKVNGSPIQPRISDEDIMNGRATRLPKELTADSTWNFFGDLVEATVDRINPSVTPSANQEPLKIVIFTSAASSLLDINALSHTHGIDDFWDKSQHHFSKSKVQSIEIVVVMGETVVDRTAKDRDDGVVNGNVLCSNGVDNEDNDIKKANDLDKLRQEKTNASNGETDGGQSYDSKNNGIHSRFNGSLKTQSELIKIMQRYIKSKVEANFTRNCSRIQFDSKFVEAQSGTKISLSVIDSAVDFHSMCQKWSRESIHAATSVNGNQPSTSISFQLPQTTHFDACDLSFTTFYKNMPFRVDSSKVKQLYADLQLLSKTKLKVLQLVPMLSIDASLIYGITIGLRAVHEDEEERHHEKSFVVRSLFNDLASRDCALILCSMNDPGMSTTNCRDDATNTDLNGLFHSSEESQYFLFMPEFVFSPDGPAAPKTGVLRRIAGVDHILEEMNAVDTLKSANPSYSDLGNKFWQRESPLSTYVEASLDSLKCSSMNPWIQDKMKNSISASFTVDTKKQTSNKASSSTRSNTDDSSSFSSSGESSSFGTFDYGTQ